MELMWMRVWAFMLWASPHCTRFIAVSGNPLNFMARERSHWWFDCWMTQPTSSTFTPTKQSHCTNLNKLLTWYYTWNNESPKPPWQWLRGLVKLKKPFIMNQAPTSLTDKTHPSYFETIFFYCLFDSYHVRQINSAAFDVSAKHLKYEEKNNVMQIISGFPCSKKATRNKFLILTP